MMSKRVLPFLKTDVNLEFLNADFLLLFEEAAESETAGIRFRLVEVQTGIRWLDQVFEVDENNPEHAAARLTDLFRDFISEKDNNVKYYVSVIPFENHTTDYGLDSRLLGLTRLLEMIVVQTDDMVLLEREDARLLLQEHAVSSLRLSPKSSILILSGSLNRTQPDSQGNTLRQFTLQVSSPGRTPEKQEIAMERLFDGDPVATMHTFLQESRFISNNQPDSAYHLKDESALLLKRADELSNLGQYEAASESYAALLMLGMKTKHIYHSLIMSYATQSQQIAYANKKFSDSFYDSMLKQLDLLRRAVWTLDEAYSVGYYDQETPYELRWALSKIGELLGEEKIINGEKAYFGIISIQKIHFSHLTPDQLSDYQQFEKKVFLQTDALMQRILEKADLWYLSKETAGYIRDVIDHRLQPDDTQRNRIRLEEARRILEENPRNSTPFDAENIYKALRLISSDLSRSEKQRLDTWDNVYVNLFVNYWNYVVLRDNKKALPLMTQCRDAWKEIAASSSPEFLSKLANNLGEDVAVKMAFDADRVRYELGYKDEAVSEIINTLKSFP